LTNVAIQENQTIAIKREKPEDIELKLRQVEFYKGRESLFGRRAPKALQSDMRKQASQLYRPNQTGERGLSGYSCDPSDLILRCENCGKPLGSQAGRT
jgi:hypothetical protein